MDQYKRAVMQNAAAATANGTPLEVSEVSGGALSTLVAQVTGTFTATITWEGTTGVSATQTNNVWVALPAENITSGAVATTATATGIYRMVVTGLSQVRARVTWSSGTSVTVTGQVVAAALPPPTLSESIIGLVGTSDTVLEVSPPLDDSGAYTAGDLLFDSVALSGAARVDGGVAIVESITVIDKDDQKQPLALLFASAMTDFGTFNQAPNPDDTETATVLGHVSIAASDYVDLGGASVACVRGVGLMLKAPGGSTSLALAGVTTGTPTHTTAGMTILVGLLRS